MVPPKKVQPGMLQSSLVQTSVATMQNPMGCPLPRLSVSRPASMVASLEAVADGSALLTVMKWKTVLAVFVVVVAYLVAGGLVFKALEQPFESNQKDTITSKKAAFLEKHHCVTPNELEELIKVKLLLVCSRARAVSLTYLLPYTFSYTPHGPVFISVFIIRKVEKFLSSLFVLHCVTLFFTTSGVFRDQFKRKSNAPTSEIKVSFIHLLQSLPGGNRRIEYREWYKPLVWFWILVGMAYFAAVLSMIGDWLRVLSKKTKMEVRLLLVGEIKAHAAEWKANVRAEFRETRRRLSVEVHDKLQRAATIRSMERRQLGFDQRANSLDMLSPERRAAFNSLDKTNFKTSSQESIDTKLNNLRLRIEQNEHRRSDPSQAYSEENIFNRLGSVTKLAKRNKNKELRKNIPDDGRKVLDSFTCNTPTMDEEKKEAEDDELEKEVNTSLTSLPLFVESPNKQNGFMPLPPQTKEEENEIKLEDEEFHLQIEP
uniref:Potassium channel, subfamily K, member 10a n=1 Tax=Cyprinus carpio TaxID=7962 RepID=A0A8C1GEI4_CYPCA